MSLTEMKDLVKRGLAFIVEGRLLTKEQYERYKAASEQESYYDLLQLNKKIAL